MIRKPSIKAGPLSRFLQLLGVLSRPLWRPEPDEKRFLVGQPITLVLILFLWKQGIDPLGGYAVQASFVLWSAAYVIRYRQRLTERGELRRVIIAPAIFVALLLCVRFY